jgi:hypothetical protein
MRRFFIGLTRFALAPLFYWFTRFESRRFFHWPVGFGISPSPIDG